MKKILLVLGLLVSNAYGQYDAYASPYSPYCTLYDWNSYSTSYELNFMLHLQCLDQVIQDLEARLAALEEQVDENTMDIAEIRNALCAIQRILEAYCCQCSTSWLDN